MTSDAGSPLLSVRDLRTSFRTEEGLVQAVDGISFDIYAGETVGLVGESGCGKTITSLSILDLVPKPRGRIDPGSSIVFGGEELVGAAESRLRAIRGKDIAMIFQDPKTSLNPVMTIGAQIAEVLRLHRGLGRAEARAEVVTLLHEVGIFEPASRVDSYPNQLSGGMLQRVMIAMALSCEPQLLIADEPTTALDVTIQAQILDLLADLRERRGMAILLVTHDLGVVAEVCDRVLVMYAGQIIEAGRVEDVFSQPSHPYTQGLLAALPGVTPRGNALRPIRGSVPSPLDWPTGCRFVDRCDYGWERCSAEPPPLVAVEGGEMGQSSGSDPRHDPPSGQQLVRCWMVDEPDRRRAASETPPVVPQGVT